MAFVKEVFDLPAELMTKVIDGGYGIKSFVVKHGEGGARDEIVNHIKPIFVKTGEGHHLMKKKEKRGFFARNKKKLTIGALAVCAAAAGYCAYKKYQEKDSPEASAFRTALDIYMTEIRNGSITLGSIDYLKITLDDLMAAVGYGGVEYEIPDVDFEILVNEIKAFTEKFAENKGLELTKYEKEPGESPVLDLQKLLQAQRRIIDEADEAAYAAENRAADQETESETADE